MVTFVDDLAFSRLYFEDVILPDYPVSASQLVGYIFTQREDSVNITMYLRLILWSDWSDRLPHGYRREIEDAWFGLLSEAFTEASPPHMTEYTNYYIQPRQILVLMEYPL
jgi:hypothetical protein